MVPVKKGRIPRPPDSDSETDEEYIDPAQAQASIRDYSHSVREPEQLNFLVLPKSPGCSARPLPAVPSPTWQSPKTAHPLPALPPKKPQSSTLNDTSGGKPLPPVPQRTNKERPPPFLPSKIGGPQAVPIPIPPQVPLRQTSASPPPSPSLPVKKARPPPLVPKKPTAIQQESPVAKKKPIPPPRVPIVPRNQSQTSSSDSEEYDDALAFRQTLTTEEKSEIQSKALSVQQIISNFNNSQ